MSLLRTNAALACLLLLAASATTAMEGPRAQLGVGLVILRECPPATLPPQGDPLPAEESRPRAPGPSAQLEEFTHCAGGPARVVSQDTDDPDPTRPASTRGARGLLVEF